MNLDAAESIIKAVDAAVGTAAVLWLGRRLKKDALLRKSERGIAAPATPTNEPLSNNTSSPAQETKSISARIFRALAWLLVGFLYLISAYLFLYGVFGGNKVDLTVNDKHPLARLLGSIFGQILGIAVPGFLFLYLAYWGHKRLKRHSA